MVQAVWQQSPDLQSAAAGEVQTVMLGFDGVLLSYIYGSCSAEFHKSMLTYRISALQAAAAPQTEDGTAAVLAT